MLFYVPETYQDRRQMPKIITFKCDMSVIFLGVVDGVVHMNNRSRSTVFEAYMSDETGQIKCVWFNQLYLKKIFQQGRRFIVKGKVVLNRRLFFL